MLYPDLRRLSLLCPTGANNDHEASGSNDPLPPPLSRARLGEGEEAPATAGLGALEVQDVLHAILFSLVDGDFVDVCRNAARWCTLNKAHMAACDDNIWTQLTHMIFPKVRRGPNTGRADVAEPASLKDWFFHICTQHKKLRDLREKRFELAKKRVSVMDDASKNYVEWATKYAKLDYRWKQLFTILERIGPPYLPHTIRVQLENKKEEADEGMEHAWTKMEHFRQQGASAMLGHHPPVRKEDDERILRAISLQKAYIRDINTDPTLQGPLTARDYIKRRLARATKVEQDRDLARLAAEEAMRRKRELSSERVAQHKAWLLILEKASSREAALSRLVAEAGALIKYSRLLDPQPKERDQLRSILARVLKARRALHTLANNPDKMNPLESELERCVRSMGHVMDKSITVYDLFGSEEEEEEEDALGGL